MLQGCDQPLPDKAEVRIPYTFRSPARISRVYWSSWPSEFLYIHFRLSLPARNTIRRHGCQHRDACQQQGGPLPDSADPALSGSERRFFMPASKVHSGPCDHRPLERRDKSATATAEMVAVRLSNTQDMLASHEVDGNFCGHHRRPGSRLDRPPIVGDS